MSITLLIIAGAFLYAFSMNVLLNHSLRTAVMEACVDHFAEENIDMLYDWDGMKVVKKECKHKVWKRYGLIDL